MAIDTDALTSRQWAVIARNFKELKHAADPSQLEAAAADVGEALGAPVKPRTLFRWFQSVDGPVRQLLIALHREARARDELQGALEDVRRAVHTDPGPLAPQLAASGSEGGGNDRGGGGKRQRGGDDHDSVDAEPSFGLAAIVPTMRRRPLLVALENVSNATWAHAATDAAGKLSKQSAAEVDRAVAAALSAVTGSKSPAPSATSAAAVEAEDAPAAVEPLPAGAMKLALSLGRKATKPDAKPAGEAAVRTATPQTQVVTPPPGAKSAPRTLAELRAAATTSAPRTAKVVPLSLSEDDDDDADSDVATQQLKRPQPSAERGRNSSAAAVTVLPLPSKKQQPATAPTAEAEADSFLAKLEGTPKRHKAVAGEIRLQDAPAQACRACGGADGDLLTCRFCKHPLHELCGGPRPDHPPTMRRCEACSRALGLPDLTSSDDDEDSRSDGDSDDTSLDGFIASESESDFDLGLVQDSDDDAAGVVADDDDDEDEVRDVPAPTKRREKVKKERARRDDNDVDSVVSETHVDSPVVAQRGRGRGRGGGGGGARGGGGGRGKSRGGRSRGGG
jgi:hypothetical protein